MQYYKFGQRFPKLSRAQVQQTKFFRQILAKIKLERELTLEIFAQIYNFAYHFDALGVLQNVQETDSRSDKFKMVKARDFGAHPKLTLRAPVRQNRAIWPF